MPGRDGTGPLGKGAMTGRGAGYCNDGQNPQNTQQQPSFQPGRGLGRQNRGRFFQDGR